MPFKYDEEASSTDTQTSGDWSGVDALDPHIDAALKKYPDVPKALMRAVAKQESGGKLDATGDPTIHGTAKGPYQFINSTARQYVPGWVGPQDSMDPARSSEGAAAYLSDLLKKYDGDTAEALKDYYGRGYHATGPTPEEYAAQVMEKMGVVEKPLKSGFTYDDAAPVPADVGEGDSYPERVGAIRHEAIAELLKKYPDGNINFFKEFPALAKAGGQIVTGTIGELPIIKQAGELAAKAVSPVIEGIKRDSEVEAKALGIDPNKPHDLYSLATAAAKALPQPVKDLGGATLAAVSFIPGAAAGGVSAKVAKQALSKTAENVNKLTGRLSEWATGVDEKALRMGGTEEGRKVLEKAFDTQYSIGEELTDILDNVDQYIPERGVVENALQRMPPIRMDRIFEKMDEVKIVEGSPSAIAANARVDNLKKIYSDMVTETKPVEVRGVPAAEGGGTAVAASKAGEVGAPAGKIGQAQVTSQEPMSAAKFRELRKQLDYEIKSSFNKDPGEATIFEKQAKEIRTAMKDELIRSAESSGNKAYVTAMRTWSDKLDKIESLKSVLGGNDLSRRARSETFINNINNKGRKQARKWLQDFSDVVGKDFVERAQLAKWADQFGDGGTGAWLPRWTTGNRAGLMGKIATAVVGSPKIASRVTLPLTQKLEDITKKKRPVMRKVARGIGAATSSSMFNHAEEDDE